MGLVADQILWSQIKSGDVDSFELIMKRHYNELYKYGTRILADPDAVKDALQSIFSKVWQKRKTLNDVENVRAYLMTSIRREILKQVSRSKIHRNTEESGFQNQFEFSVENTIIEAETILTRRKDLFKAINNLTPNQREIIYLKFYRNLEVDEIAEILAIKNQSVYNLLSASIKSLKTSMGALEATIILMLNCLA